MESANTLLFKLGFKTLFQNATDENKEGALRAIFDMCPNFDKTIAFDKAVQLCTFTNDNVTKIRSILENKKVNAVSRSFFEPNTKRRKLVYVSTPSPSPPTTPASTPSPTPPPTTPASTPSPTPPHTTPSPTPPLVSNVRFSSDITDVVCGEVEHGGTVSEVLLRVKEQLKKTHAELPVPDDTRLRKSIMAKFLVKKQREVGPGPEYDEVILNVIRSSKSAVGRCERAWVLIKRKFGSRHNLPSKSAIEYRLRYLVNNGKNSSNVK